MSDVSSPAARSFPTSTQLVPADPSASFLPPEHSGAVPSQANTVNVGPEWEHPAPAGTATSFPPQPNALPSPADLPQQPSQNTVVPSSQNLSTATVQGQEQLVKADVVLIKTNVESSAESDSQSQTSTSAVDAGSQLETQAESSVDLYLYGPSYEGGSEKVGVLGKRKDPPTSQAGSEENGGEDREQKDERKKVKVCTRTLCYKERFSHHGVG